MREIQFRAWSIKDKSYINGFNMIGFSLGQGAPRQQIYRYSSQWFEGEFILEQFTGVFNNQEVKLFEGDIVTHPYEFDRYRKIGFNSLGTVCTISESGQHACTTLMMPELEVVGNGYENPELLESSCKN